MKRIKLLAGVAALAAASASMPAQALTFVLTPAAGAAGAGVAPGTLARQGFEIAAAYWSSVLSGSNVTVNLTIGFASLDPGVLAQAGSARTLLSMNQFYTAANNNISSAIDAQAYANLPTLGTSTSVTGAGAVTALAHGFNNGTNATNGYTTTTNRIDNDGSVNNSTLAITKASAKALGITTDVNGAAVNYATADAAITFSSNFEWDFNPSDGITSTAFDFIGVAIHEIGHALGFVSGVDSVDARTAPGQTTAAQLSSLEGFVVMSQLDLFRYSAESNGLLDWRSGGTSYFSVDQGANQLFGDSRFSTGQLNGDGRQASHFKDSPAGAPQLGNLDPTSARGQMQEVTALDLAAFDVIGWNLGGFDVLANSNYRYTTASIYRDYFAAQAVPEPATWMMMILGFGAIGFGMRRRNTKVAVTYA